MGCSVSDSTSIGPNSSSSVKTNNFMQANSEKTVNKVCLVNIITEDQIYECSNGLIGMNRDINFRLIIMTNDDSKRRSLIGIGNELYLWTKQRAWKTVLYRYRMWQPRPAMQGVRYFVGAGMHNMVSLDGGVFRTVYLPINLSSDNKRALLLEAKISGYVSLGLASRPLFPALFSTELMNRNGTCALHYNGLYTGIQCVFEALLWGGGGGGSFSTPYYSRYAASIPVINFKLPLSVRMELYHHQQSASPAAAVGEECERVLHIFLENSRLRHCVTNVPDDVVFAVSSSLGGSAVVQSIRTLSAPTAWGGTKTQTKSQTQTQQQQLPQWMQPLPKRGADVDAMWMDETDAAVAPVRHRWRK